MATLAKKPVVFHHNGHPIDFNPETGMFLVVIKGRATTLGSLQGAKALIDKKLGRTIEPFFAYDVDSLMSGDAKIVKVRVVAIERANPRYFSSSPSWVCEIPSRKKGTLPRIVYRHKLWPGTAEGLAAAKRWVEASKEQDAVTKRLQDRKERLKKTGGYDALAASFTHPVVLKAIKKGGAK